MKLATNISGDRRAIFPACLIWLQYCHSLGHADRGVSCLNPAKPAMNSRFGQESQTAVTNSVSCGPCGDQWPGP